jgi:hypothetical protein
VVCSRGGVALFWIPYLLLVAAFCPSAISAQEPALLSGVAAVEAAAQNGRPARGDTDTVSPAPSPSLPAVVVPLSRSQKVAFYVDRTYSPRVFLRAGFGAGVAQWRHAPKEWGSGLPGYERRYAAILGAAVVRNTMEFGVGTLLHEDQRYERSVHDGFGPRTVDVIHNTIFIRTDEGGHELAWSRGAAAIVTGVAVNSWQPSRLRGTSHALLLILGGFVSYGTGNFTSEFGPDVRKYVRRHLSR